MDEHPTFRWGVSPQPHRVDSTCFCDAHLVASWTLATLLLAGCVRQSVHTTTGEEQEPVFTNSIGMQLVLVPAGDTLMGSPDSHRTMDGSQPRHRVRITQPFYMGAYEVTQEEYELIMVNRPSHFGDTGVGWQAVEGLDTKRYPVDRVTWGEAVEFCRRLSELPEEEEAGRVYRLPTEAQWEYACRAGTESAYSFGDTINLTQANINGVSNESAANGPLLRTAHVGSYPPNAFGLCDMHGNVWEWCVDGNRPYSASQQEDPQGPPALYYMLRGGAWDFPAEFCRSDYRTEAMAGYVYFGFRVVCEVAKEGSG